MNCAICTKPAKHIFTIEDYKVYECLNCTHRMTSIKDPGSHVANTYSDDYFYGGGAGYPNYLDESAILIRHGRYYAKVLSKHIEKVGKLVLESDEKND